LTIDKLNIIDSISITKKGNRTMTQETKEQTLGNKLKFKLEFMFIMLNAGRKEEAIKMYEQLIEEFDKLS
tara:strand:+ start:700 stop:909 length:210 start_codon:yes stop_codon:yes gene_type:complete